MTRAGPAMPTPEGSVLRPLPTPRPSVRAFVRAVAPRDPRVHLTHVRPEPRLLTADPPLAPLVRVRTERPPHAHRSTGRPVRSSGGPSSPAVPTPADSAPAAPAAPATSTDAAPARSGDAGTARPGHAAVAAGTVTRAVAVGPGPEAGVALGAGRPSRAAAPPLGPGVPIVRGPAAERLAGQAAARAVTRDGVVHLPDRHGPTAGVEAQALLAHELVHVATGLRGRPAADTGRAADAEERRAVAAEAAVRAGTLPPPQVTEPTTDPPSAPTPSPTDSPTPFVRTRTNGQSAVNGSPPSDHVYELEHMSVGAHGPVPTTEPPSAAARSVSPIARPVSPVAQPDAPPPFVRTRTNGQNPVNGSPPSDHVYGFEQMSVGGPERASVQPSAPPPRPTLPSSGVVLRAPEAPLPPDPADTARGLPPEQIDRIYRAVRDRLSHDLLLARERSGGLLDPTWR